MVCVVLQSYPTEEERDDARHGEPIRKEVASIRTECDKARLDGGIEVEGGVFQHQGHRQTETDA